MAHTWHSLTVLAYHYEARLDNCHPVFDALHRRLVCLRPLPGIKILFGILKQCVDELPHTFFAATLSDMKARELRGPAPESN